VALTGLPPVAAPPFFFLFHSAFGFFFFICFSHLTFAITFILLALLEELNASTFRDIHCRRGANSRELQHDDYPRHHPHARTLRRLAGEK
jgi:hypothetical protein